MDVPPKQRRRACREDLTCGKITAGKFIGGAWRDDDCTESTTKSCELPAAFPPPIILFCRRDISGSDGEVRHAVNADSGALESGWSAEFCRATHDPGRAAGQRQLWRKF